MKESALANRSHAELVRTERRDAIAIVTLNDPDRYNSLDVAMLEALRDGLEAVLDKPDVRAVLLTGAGRGFCGGARLDGALFDTGAAIGSLLRDRLNPLIERMRASATPIVVAVNGPAAGAGVGLALAGDVVLAARSARFVFSFARLGAAMDAGTSFFVPLAIGAARTRALALLGRSLSAETAADWGLIWDVVDDDALPAASMAIVDQLAAGPTVGLGLIKGQLHGALSASLASEAAAQAKAFETEDLREGARAFVEKREPRFAGS